MNLETLINAAFVLWAALNTTLPVIALALDSKETPYED